MQHNNYSMESQKGDSFFSFALKFMISRFTAQSYASLLCCKPHYIKGIYAQRNVYRIAI